MVDILSESLFMAVLRGLRAAGAVPLAGARCPFIRPGAFFAPKKSFESR